MLEYVNFIGSRILFSGRQYDGEHFETKPIGANTHDCIPFKQNRAAEKTDK